MIANDETPRRSSAPQARARREAAGRGNAKSEIARGPGSAAAHGWACDLRVQGARKPNVTSHTRVRTWADGVADMRVPWLTEAERDEGTATRQAQAPRRVKPETHAQRGARRCGEVVRLSRLTVPTRGDG